MCGQRVGTLGRNVPFLCEDNLREFEFGALTDQAHKGGGQQGHFGQAQSIFILI
jgi:hypothetical protein